MSEWAPISDVPAVWRGRFIEFAQKGLIRTRASEIHADQRDPATVSAIQLSWYREYRGNRSPEAEEELSVALLSVPIVRNHDVPLELIWAHAHGDAIDWDTSTFVHGDGPGSLQTFASGIEFNVESARAHGLQMSLPSRLQDQINSLAPAADTASYAQSMKGRRRATCAEISRAVQSYIKTLPQPRPSDRDIAAAIRENLDGFASRDTVIRAIRDKLPPLRPGPRRRDN